MNAIGKSIHEVETGFEGMINIYKSAYFTEYSL